MATTLPDIRIKWTSNRRVLERTGMVYYFERADGAIKIGYTHRYPRRRDQLVARHGRLRLIAWEHGSSDLEAQRHEQFGHLRINPIAEWFRPGEDLVDHVLMLLALA